MRNRALTGTGRLTTGYAVVFIHSGLKCPGPGVPLGLLPLTLGKCRILSTELPLSELRLPVTVSLWHGASERSSSKGHLSAANWSRVKFSLLQLYSGQLAAGGSISDADRTSDTVP